LTRRCVERSPNDIDPGFLIVVLSFQSAKRLDGSWQRDASAGKDAFLDSGARSSWKFDAI
jgi:hypothetical protein